MPDLKQVNDALQMIKGGMPTRDAGREVGWNRMHILLPFVREYFCNKEMPDKLTPREFRIIMGRLDESEKKYYEEQKREREEQTKLGDWFKRS